MARNRILGAVLACVGVLAGCSSRRPEVNLETLGPDGAATKQIRGGGRIGVLAAGFVPPGATYSWIASGGRCIPQRGEKAFTSCEAPRLRLGQRTEMLTISLDIEAAGRIFHDVAQAVVTVTGDSASSAPTPANPAVPGAKGQIQHEKQRPRENPRPARSLSIEITPPFPAIGQGGPETSERISGRVTGAEDWSDYRVVLFARDETGTWFVQPFTAAPFTRISSDSTFTNSTHRGQIYAALLVQRSFVPPNATSVLPEDGVLAIAQYAGR